MSTKARQSFSSPLDVYHATGLEAIIDRQTVPRDTLCLSSGLGDIIKASHYINSMSASF
jgi:hypothetical protein